jgi:hypothetical protein
MVHINAFVSASVFFFDDLKEKAMFKNFERETLIIFSLFVPHFEPNIRLSKWPDNRQKL